MCAVSKSLSGPGPFCDQPDRHSSDSAGLSVSLNRVTSSKLAAPPIAQAAAGGTLARQYPPLLTKQDMAELLGRSVRTIYRLESRGELPSSVNVGSQRLWVYEEVSNWIAAACPLRRAWERLHPKYHKKGH